MSSTKFLAPDILPDTPVKVIFRLEITVGGGLVTDLSLVSWQVTVKVTKS